MELIKRKIYLEGNIDRRNESITWGQVTATTFYINVMLTQNIDDMGYYKDETYIAKDNSNVDYSLLIAKLAENGMSDLFTLGLTPLIVSNLTFSELKTLRLPTKILNDYFAFGNLPITGSTDTKIDDVKSYNANNPYSVGLDINTETYTNYLGLSIDGVDRIKSNGEPINYVFNTLVNLDLGTNNQVTGLQYLDYSGNTRPIFIDGITNFVPLTNFRYIGEGWNELNTSLSASSKEEYLFGITSVPKIENDIFIDRGVTSVMDMHLRLSEIKDMGDLIRYGNGFYTVNKQ